MDDGAAHTGPACEPLEDMVNPYQRILAWERLPSPGRPWPGGSLSPYLLRSRRGHPMQRERRRDGIENAPQNLIRLIPA